jgi:hypothetical protein
VGDYIEATVDRVTNSLCKSTKKYFGTSEEVEMGAIAPIQDMHYVEQMNFGMGNSWGFHI